MYIHYFVYVLLQVNLFLALHSIVSASLFTNYLHLSLLQTQLKLLCTLVNYRQEFIFKLSHPKSNIVLSITIQV
jgi:hypothetical protein